MDYLSQLTDETLERKNHIPAAEAIIEEIKEEFNVWKGRKICANHSCFERKIELSKLLN
jgi:glutamyl-tRNA reductase